MWQGIHMACKKLLKYFNIFGKLLKGLSLLALCLMACACVGTVWTGASLVYDRHNVYKKIDDFQLAGNINRALYKDKIFKRKDCAIDVAVFNGDILLAGNVPNNTLRQLALQRASLPGKRRLFNQLSVSPYPQRFFQDSWITGQIRSQILGDGRINPNAFKIITVNATVYLMGDVLPEQAKLVIYYARKTWGVKQVVTLFKYYHLTNKQSALNT